MMSEAVHRWAVGASSCKTLQGGMLWKGGGRRLRQQQQLVQLLVEAGGGLVDGGHNGPPPLRHTHPHPLLGTPHRCLQSGL